MKPLIPEYNEPDADSFKQLWDKGLFVFDTNALLNLYRYAQASSDKLLSLAERLSDRIWIPHQVASEFSSNLPGVQDKHDKIFDELHKKLKDHLSTLDDLLIKNYKDRHPFIDVTELQKIFSAPYKRASEYLIGQKQHSSSSDLYVSISSRLYALLSDRVGPAYSVSRLLEICRIGKERYELKIPPGFMDEKSKQGIEKYGDLIIWFQLLDKATECKRPIVFITDDQKDDWLEGKRGVRSGPRHELRREMWNHAEVAFHIYSSESFTKYAGEYLDQPVDNSIVANMRATRERLAQLARDETKLRELVAQVDRRVFAEMAVRSIASLAEQFSSTEQLEAAFQQMLQTLSLSDEQRASILTAVDYDALRAALSDLAVKKFRPKIEPLVTQSGPEWLVDIPTLQASLLNLASKVDSDEPVGEEGIGDAVRLAGEHSQMMKDFRMIASELSLESEASAIFTYFLVQAMLAASIDPGNVSRRTPGDTVDSALDAGDVGAINN